MKRAALTVPGSSLTSRPTSRAPEAFRPPATPAARKPRGSVGDAVAATSARPSGTSTQREPKKLIEDSSAGHPAPGDEDPAGVST